MNRLAVFVEGYTEVVFVEKLIEEVAGMKNVLIERRLIRGGSTTRRTMRLITAARQRTGEQYYVLIYDCGGDDPVKTRILEEHSNLTKKGYSAILGLRDVRPKFSHADIPKLEADLPKYVKTSLIPVTFIPAIMEIEACSWPKPPTTRGSTRLSRWRQSRPLWDSIRRTMTWNIASNPPTTLTTVTRSAASST